jgi:TonB C terminal
MTSDQLQQNFANATGLILDRTFKNPLVLGEAFIVSKSRAVTCASSVFNYMEAPWALAVSFPHPDLLLGVKSIALHPDFDKKDARVNYLTFSGAPPDKFPAQLNDFATIVLDAVLQELQPDKVGELHRALALPFSNAGVDASGTVSGTAELLNIVKTIIDSGREGLLTLFDDQNIPVARVQITGAAIQKVYYNGIVGEMAFSELLFRNPATGFAFSGQPTFTWGNVRDISVPPSALVQESSRRANELPGALNYVGGAEARYQRSTTTLNLSGANENIQWLVQTLWNAIDGYITVDKLGQRVGADTYTVVQGIREMLNRGIISLLRKASPFPCTGQLGSPLTSHTDFDINPGDALMAFYLDPLSGAPVWQKGEFSGVSSVLQPKNLLHTVPILPGAKGALILKNYKLIGVHNGNVVAKAGQTLPPGAVAQMMFMSAMLDMSARKMRGATDGDDEGRIASLRTRAEEQPGVGGEKVERIICSNCHAINAEYGPCNNCGTEIAPEVEVEPTGKLAKILPMKQLKQLQKKSGLSDKQVMIGGAFAIGFPLFALMFCMPSSAPPAATVAPETAIGKNSSPEAVRLGVSVGFKGTAPPEYWYEDTSKQTAPAKSFGIYSETTNQKLLFLVFDDQSAVQNFEQFLLKPPFVTLTEVPQQASNVHADDGSETFGSGSLKWFVGKYSVEATEGNPSGYAKILLASFQGQNPAQSVLVIGRPLKDTATYDYKSALWLIDQMGEDFTKAENEKKISSAPGITNQGVKKADKKAAAGNDDEEDTKPVGKIATPDEIKKWLDSAQKQIQAKWTVPDGMASDVKDPKSKKLHVNFTIAIDNTGAITKIDLTDPSDVDKVNNSVQKALNAASPFKDPPQTAGNSLSLVVKLRRDKIKVSQAD